MGEKIITGNNVKMGNYSNKKKMGETKFGIINNII